MRWTAKRKAEIVVAIKDGEISTEEAKRRYEVSDDELAAWMRDYDLHGRPGLLVTKLQQPHRRTKKLPEPRETPRPVGEWLPRAGAVGQSNKRDL